MQDALIRKLESFEELSDADRAALRAFVPRVRNVSARTDLISEGDTPSDVHLILDGYACRYKMLPDG
ncbi:Crp/Fnr family transcriptional regulator, partial [Methylobacterium sp. E-065]|nr:Crp/Fnr family transcriptional regulator [Methylobacterium sp. E-065]